MRYVFAVHVPIAGMAVLPVIFNWPILLMPLHIVFFELIVDPACSIAFEAEAEEPGIMRRKPRPERTRLFSRSTIVLGLLQGLGVLVAVLVTFVFAMRCRHAAEDTRAIAFTTLVAGNLALIWANRSALSTAFEIGGVRNPALWLVTLGTLATMLVVLYVPGIRTTFQFSVLHFDDLRVSLALGSVSVTWFEVLKLIRRRTGQQNVRR